MPFRSQAPDLVLCDGNVHTMNAHDLTATALAIKDGRIAGVGLDAEMRDLAGLGTVVESLAGRTVIPGLIDAHNHLLATGRMLSQIQLFDCRGIEEIRQRVAAAVSEAEPGQWIIGRGWDESLLAEGRHPTREDLDPVSNGYPVVLYRVWNQLVANSAAMTAAGVGRHTADPDSNIAYHGSFERDNDGNPTGLFRDRAKSLITEHSSNPSEDEEIASIAKACQAYNSVGLTAVAEPGLYPAQMRAFQRAAEVGMLAVRVDMLIAGWGFGSAQDEATIQERILSSGLRGGFGNDLLRVGGVKFMPDGGVGDRTARVFEGYLDEPDNRGQWIVDPDELPGLVQWVHDLGFSIDAHTCGDEAQQVMVEAFAAAQTGNPNVRLRHRVHHAYFPTERSLRVMAQHRIPAVVSNPFITNLGESFVLSVGQDRASQAMPMRAYLDAGVPLAGSSDSLVSDYNPWAGMYAATTRTTVTGRILGAEQRITTREALRSYTIGGAYATGRESTIGSLEPGKLADLVVLDQDPVAIPADDLRYVDPVATMVGGRWVHDRR